VLTRDYTVLPAIHTFIHNLDEPHLPLLPSHRVSPLWPVLIFCPAEGRRLSWPSAVRTWQWMSCVVTVQLWSRCEGPTAGHSRTRTSPWPRRARSQQSAAKRRTKTDRTASGQFVALTQTDRTASGQFVVLPLTSDHGQLTRSAYVWVRFSCVVAIMSKAANTAMKNESLIVVKNILMLGSMVN